MTAWDAVPCPARGCGQPVVWAWTRRGRRLALNPEPDPKGNQAAYRDGTGRWYTRQLARDDDTEPRRPERRYMPHVATCTERRPQAPAVLPKNVIPITRARRPRGVP